MYICTRITVLAHNRRHFGFKFSHPPHAQLWRGGAGNAHYWFSFPWQVYRLSRRWSFCLCSSHAALHHIHKKIADCIFVYPGQCVWTHDSCSSNGVHVHMHTHNRTGAQPSPIRLQVFGEVRFGCAFMQDSHGLAALAGALVSYAFGPRTATCPSLTCPTVHCSQVTCPPAQESNFGWPLLLAAIAGSFWCGWAARRFAWSFFSAVDGRSSPALGRSAAWRPS